MPRRLLLVVDGILLVVAALPGGTSLRGLERAPGHGPVRVRPGRHVSSRPRLRRRTPARTPLTAYAVVAERNLFSATRTETAPEPPRPAAAGPPAPPGAQAAALRRRAPAGGPGPGLPGRRPAASRLRVLRGGPRGGLPGRADQGGPGGDAPRGRDLRGPALRPCETSPACRTPRRTIARGWSSGSTGRGQTARAGAGADTARAGAVASPGASCTPGGLEWRCRLRRLHPTPRRRKSRPRRNDREASRAAGSRLSASPCWAGVPDPEPADPRPCPAPSPRW